MAKLSREDVLKLAYLSRLDLTKNEVEKFRVELGEILKYVEQLKEIDIEGVEPTQQVTNLTNVTRPDELIDYQAKPKDLMANVPTVKDGQIKVKKML